MRVYWKILEFGKEYHYRLILALFFLLLYNLFSVISLASVIPFLEILFSDIKPVNPNTELSWLDAGSIKAHAYFWLATQMQIRGKMTVLYLFCSFLLFAILGKNISRYLSSWQIAPLEQGIIQNLRNKIFSHLTHLPLSFFAHRKKGEIINVVISDVQIVQESIIGTLQSLISDPMTMLTFLLTMILISWKMTLFTLLVLPLAGIVIAIISKYLRKKAIKAQTIFDDLVSKVDEFLGGIRIVKAYSTENFESKRYADANQQFTNEMVKFRRRADLPSPLTELISIGVVIIIIIYGSSLILSNQGDLKASEFIGFIALFSQFLAPIKTFSSVISRIQKGIVSFDRIEVLLNEPEAPQESRTGEVFKGFEKEIKIENLCFKYANKDKYALKNINFVIPKGKTIALVGPSGSGKSTLVDLICRFYEPHSGEIFVDGVNLKSYRSDSWREQLGIVTQEGILFNDSIRRNIAYGVSKIDENQLIHAAKIANAHEFILSQTQQYETLIGDRGGMLSGGQRQRLAIARAVYRNPGILILDEATSALDSESEKAVQEALDSVMKDRTAIIIAHRLSTIVNADIIMVMEEGEIKETGNHAELITKNGLYRRLYDIQFQK